MFAHEREADDLDHAATLSRTRYYWFIYGDNDYTTFDFDFMPAPWEADHLHTWPTQWHQYGGAYLANKETVTEKKYNFKAEIVPLLPNKANWTIPNNIDQESFDWAWRPHPLDPPYVYHFGTQWQRAGGPIYTVPGATEIKYINGIQSRAINTVNNWKILADVESFDYSWHPDPTDPPYIYIFGNEHWPAEIMPTVRYTVPGATTIKYIEEPRAKLIPRPDKWTSLVDLPFEFEYSWCPDPGDPPYIYQFGNQWYPAELMPTVEYRVVGATEIKYIDTVHAKLLPVLDRWTVPEEVDSTNIDFSWVPHPKDAPYVHHFGSEYQSSIGLTYTVPGATEIKFEGDPPKLVRDKNAISVVAIFLIDHGNTLAQSRFDQLHKKYPTIQKVRYANGMLDTIRRCSTRSKTSKFWVISSLNTYDDFDFAWHAEPWQNYMTHIFPSQWNKWSDTYLINKYEFERHSKWARGIEEFPNLNFVTNQIVAASDDSVNIYYVDHGNDDTTSREVLLRKYPKIKVTRFVDNYLDTFKRILNTVDTEYVWILNSICDYTKFDFTWKPEPWQSEMIHVFPSKSSAGPSIQKQGDTFYIHVESFKQQMYELEILDWFNVINYCQDQIVYRLPEPRVAYEGDSLVPAVQEYQFTYPYALFAPQHIYYLTEYMPPCLWTEKYRIAEALNQSGSLTVVPKDVKKYLTSQLYDYPHVCRRPDEYFTDKLLDIVYISNGEPDAERWYNHLTITVNNQAPYSVQRIHRVQNVDGRIAAYHAAAKASTSPWFFAVFAKLEVTGSFDWGWQPDYWQEPKHYIFHSRNCLNGLEYGHMGVIAYNKKLVLDTIESGLDFTLSQKHTVVPELSAIAYFNADPWMTWRTAFREVIKLKHFMAVEPTLETEYRLDTWLTVADGDNAEWCLRGAQDAVNYYNEVQGDYAKLMLSFDWPFLQDLYNKKYK